jgi:beta-lactamase regulating signal transducer with metallopeptidase domain
MPAPGDVPAPPAAPAPDLWPALVGWVGVAHAAAAAVLLARWLLGYVGLWRLLRTAEPAPPEVIDVCRSLAGGRAVPRLFQSRRVRVPLSCGLLRPTVVLPASLCAAPAAPELRWVLAHELTHLERHDVGSCLLFGLGEVVFFALPWFWWLRRQARLCREYVADAAAAAQGAAEDYAQFLLTLTAAPAPPAGAMGVTGHTSDLFRRVAMLLQSTGNVEKRPPRLWSLGVAAGLVSLAALVAGVGLRAGGDARADEPAKKDEPKKDEPKKDEAKKDEPKKGEPKKGEEGPDLDELFMKNLPPNIPPEMARMYREQMKRAMEQMRQQGAGGFGGGFGGPFGGGGFAAGGFAGDPFGQQHDGRLGVRVKEPGATLVDQLDLPKGQGVVVESVVPDSAAAKAGLKANDILLELNGKPVSSNVAEVIKAINGLKANTPVDAVVMRKGKKETVKGISLPEARRVEAPALPGGGPPGGFAGGAGFGGGAGFAGGAGGFGGLPGMPGVPGGFAGGGGFGGGGFAGGNTVMTTVFRNGDRFTARHQEGNLVLTVIGTVADGKATTKEIVVQDAAKSDKYEGVDKVPEQYRDKVKNLIEMGEKGAAKVEIK